MMMNQKEWLELISRGESETLELRGKLPADNEVARTLSAFANTEGGTLILGVGRRGNIRGLTEEEVDQAVVKLNYIASTLFPESGQFKSSSVRLGGRRLVYVAVAKATGNRSPVAASNGTAYRRQGAATVRLDADGGGNPAPQTAPAAAEAEAPGKQLVMFVAMSFRYKKKSSLVDYYRAMQRAAEAVERAGLPVRLVRMDLLAGDYEIPARLMQAIDEADIVLADFTLNSANVYFELGYARGLGKRVIQTAHKSTVLQFDIRNWRTLFYENASELEDLLIPELESACAEWIGPAK